MRQNIRWNGAMRNENSFPRFGCGNVGLRIDETVVKAIEVHTGSTFFDRATRRIVPYLFWFYFPLFSSTHPHFLYNPEK